MTPRSSGPGPDEHLYDVVVVGSLNLDLVATTKRHPVPGETVAGLSYDEYPGGKGLNQAVAAARVGAHVALIGSVGDDEAGRTLREVADAEGIDTSRITTVSDVPTGRAVITVDENGENSIVVVAGANHLVEPDRIELPAARVLLVQLEIPIASVTAACRGAVSAGTITLLDPAPAAELPDELVSACWAIIPNEHEVEIAGGATSLLSRGAGCVIVTLGDEGVEAVSPDRATSFRHDVFPVDVVDTTGAGDAFRGALAARLAAGDGLDAAVHFASAAGALATTTHGAVPSLPRLDQVAALALTG